MVPESTSFGRETFRMESADEKWSYAAGALLSARLFGTKLNPARLQFISLQERPKPILDARRFGVVGTAIPRSWYRCSAHSVLQGAFIVHA